MNTKEFKKNYIEHYILLEQDFKSTFDYVTLENNNYKTYSNAYLKQLLSIGSEIDILKKLIAKLYDSSFNEKKGNAYSVIQNNFSDIKNLEIKIRPTDEIITPWKYKNEADWWTAYNEIKHNRLDNSIHYIKDDNGNRIVDEKWDKNKKWYQYANLEYVLYSLAALFSLELIAYRKLALDENNELFIPYIKSLFCINNSFWTDIQHGNGMIFSNGILHIDDHN